MSKPDPTDLSSLMRERRKRKQSETPESSVESTPETSSSASQKKVGRPRGRRSNPNVSPLNLLIDEDLILEVRFKLGKQNKGQIPKKTLSDLVEQLLTDWVEDS